MKEYFKEKKILLIVVLTVIFLLAIGVTYAWFSRQITGNEEAKEMLVETGTLELLFEDGPEIEGKYVNPGWSETKTFKVTNTGTLDTNYTIWWKDFVNTIEKDELVYFLTCTSYSDYDTNTEGGNCYGFDEKAMNTAEDLRILSNIAIPSGYTHEYEITLLFKETGSNQNYNQGKTFTGTINIKEYYENELDIPVIESYNTSNYTLTATATDSVGIMSYALTYPIADLVPEDIEWINITNKKELNLEVAITDYKAILWVKNRAGNVAYADITPRPTLVVDPNEGTWEGNISEQTYNMTYDETKEVSNPTREGYTFNGWDIQSEGSESAIINQTFTMGEKDTTLEAQWEINEYTLTVNPNGGSYNSSTNNTTYEIEYNSTQNIVNPTRTGYTFTGWTVSSNKAVLNTNILTIGSEDCTLTANWTVNSYPWIAYHNKMNTDGSGYTLVDADTERGSANYGSTVTPSVKTYTGFNSPSAQDLVISEVEANNIVNYNYERQKYNLTINPNSGSYNSSTSNTTMSVYYNQSITINTPTKTGYNFTNWSKSGGGTLTDNVFTGGLSESTLTANYSPITSTVSFNVNGGDTTHDSITVTYGSTYGTLPTPTRTNYEFLGWYTAASGGTQITSSTTVSITSSQTLYAQWKLIAYVITFNPNGGSVSPTSKSVAINSTYGTLPTPTRTNYEFLGWYTSASGGTQILATSSLVSSSNHTLYAHWRSIYLANRIIETENTPKPDNASSTYVSSSSGINFGVMSSNTNGKGLYYTTNTSLTEDLNGDGVGDRVYYFRGAVTNNNVKFAGYCWRVIRINEDGTVRMRYNGTYSSGTCPVTGTSVTSGNVAFNTSTADLRYVGYMYGSSCSSYANCHSNNTNSNIKNNLESWYKSKLSSYSSYIADAIYCNDRQKATSSAYGFGSGYGSSSAYFKFADRLLPSDGDIWVGNSPSAKPTFKCGRTEDKFTTTTALGNGKNSYPIGLITIDEVIFAGGVWQGGGNQTSYYLYTNDSGFMTMTPAGWYEGSARYVASASGGYLGQRNVTKTNSTVQPVISLKATSVVLSGNGSYTSPYVITN